MLVKSRLPAHNRALRRKVEAGVLEIVDGVPRFVAAAGIDLRAAVGQPTVRSRRAHGARERCAHSRPSTGCAGCGWGSSGAPVARASRGSSPLRRRLRRRGVDRRRTMRASPTRWRRCDSRVAGAGLALVRECAVPASAPTCTCFATGAGSAPRATTASSRALLEAPQSAAFDLDVAKLLLRRHRAGTLRLIAAHAGDAERREAPEYA